MTTRAWTRRTRATAPRALAAPATRPAARRVTAVAAALALVLGATLSGCGTAGPVKVGAAATVGDQRIPTAQVEAAAKEWREQARKRGITDRQLRQAAERLSEYMVDPNSPERSVLFQMISSALIDELARAQHVTVSPAQVDQEIRRRGARQLDFYAFISAVPPSMQREWVAGELRAQEVARRNGAADGERGRTLLQRLIAETAQRVGVRVNPRFGSYDIRLHFLTPQCTALSKGAGAGRQQVPPPEFGGPRKGCNPLGEPAGGQR